MSMVWERIAKNGVRVIVDNTSTPESDSDAGLQLAMCTSEIMDRIDNCA